MQMMAKSGQNVIHQFYNQYHFPQVLIHKRAAAPWQGHSHVGGGRERKGHRRAAPPPNMFSREENF